MIEKLTDVKQIIGKKVKGIMFDLYDEDFTIIFTDKSSLTLTNGCDSIDVGDDVTYLNGLTDEKLRDNGFLTIEQYNTRVDREKQLSEFYKQDEEKKELEELQRLKKKYEK